MLSSARLFAERLVQRDGKGSAQNLLERSLKVAARQEACRRRCQPYHKFSGTHLPTQLAPRDRMTVRKAPPQQMRRSPALFCWLMAYNGEFINNICRVYHHFPWSVLRLFWTWTRRWCAPTAATTCLQTCFTAVPSPSKCPTSWETAGWATWSCSLDLECRPFWSVLQSLQSSFSSQRATQVRQNSCTPK